MERCLFFLQLATGTIKTSPAEALQGTEQEVAGLRYKRLKVSHASLWEDIIGQLEIYLLRKYLPSQFCVLRIMLLLSIPYYQLID